MSYYAIAIGGTGAKCLEALIHLCAAGLMPGSEDLHLLFVDSDQSNGNGKRALDLLENYQRCRGPESKSGELFKTRTPVLADSENTLIPNRWSPTQTDDRLKTFIKSNLLDDAFGDLFRVLFTEAEAETVLDQGFRGRPAIGSVVMASSVDLNSSEPWKTLRSKMRADLGAGHIPKVMVFGSIFGGTGAAGFPTISRLLRQWANQEDGQLRLGGSLMLPYFSFDGNQILDSQLHVRSEEFIRNSKAALKFYQQANFHEILDTVYLLGCDQPLELPAVSLGGKEQVNPPNWLELVSALSAIDFFGNDGDLVQPYRLLARNSNDRVEWSDLPGDGVRTKLTQLARFCFAFLGVYLPMMENIHDRGAPHRAPWYMEFFEYKGVQLGSCLNTELMYVRNYCIKFLEWYANIQSSATTTDDVGSYLVDYSSFTRSDNGQLRIRVRQDGERIVAEFDLSGFENIDFPELNGKPAGLSALWERMSKINAPRGTVTDAWPLIWTLYREVGLLSR